MLVAYDERTTGLSLMPAALVEAGQAIVSRALNFGAQKANLAGPEEVVAALRRGHRAAYDYFRYGLAKEFGSYLGNAEATVKSVYLFEPEVMSEEFSEEEPSLTRRLHLIIWVANGKESVTARAQAMGEVLLEQYQALLGPAVAAMDSLVEVDIADDSDVERRMGAGAIITSIYTPPLRVWSRFVIKLNPEHCGRCLICANVCPYGAITLSPGATAVKIDVEKCQVCGICFSACPSGAVESAYYDLVSLVREVRSSVRSNGHKALALTCRGSAPTASEIEQILGAPGFVPICLPCVGRTPTEFFLKALSMGIERIAVIPCKDDHCRFQDGSRISRNRMLLLRATLEALNYDPDMLLLRQAEGPIAVVDADLCSGCGSCMRVCPYGAISADGRDKGVLFLAQIDPALCHGCGACVVECPSRAIALSRFADERLLAEIESALASAPGSERVLGFRCNWCSYGDHDLPYERLHFSEDIEVIRVPCVARIDPLHVLWAFLNGAAGVFLGGCHSTDCRYISGSTYGEERISTLKRLLKVRGFDPERLQLRWFRRDEPDAYGEALRSFAAEVRRLTPQTVRSN